MTGVTLDVQVAKVTERVGGLEERFDRYEKAQSEALKGLTNKIEDMRDNLAGRPTWFMLSLVTLLGSAVVGLLVKLAGVKGGL